MLILGARKEEHFPCLDNKTHTASSRSDVNVAYATQQATSVQDKGPEPDDVKDAVSDNADCAEKMRAIRSSPTATLPVLFSPG